VHHVIQSDLSIGEAVVREGSGMERSSPFAATKKPRTGNHNAAARSPVWLASQRAVMPSPMPAGTGYGIALVRGAFTTVNTRDLWQVRWVA